MKPVLLAFILIFTMQLGAAAQQAAQYSQYMFNTLVINPAYAGYKGGLNVSLLHRNQWVGLQGAPKTQSIVVDDAFNRVGLGLTIVNDKIGLQGHTSVYGNYSYSLPVGKEDSRLAFGLAVGLSQYTLDENQASVGDLNDPNFTEGKRIYFTPDAKFGLYYSNVKLYAGISVINLLSPAFNYRQDGKDMMIRQAKQFFLTAGYLVDLTEDLKFKPSVMVREDTKSPTNVDLSTFFLIKDAVWLGASYRTGVNILNSTDFNSGLLKQNSLVGTMELFVARKFRLGYSYDYSLSALGDYSNGTHEISVGIALKTTKNTTSVPTPRYF
jgi:type IX secretion system PorP/SprF family membrane protein